jgi:hypothetical protein
MVAEFYWQMGNSSLVSFGPRDEVIEEETRISFLGMVQLCSAYVMLGTNWHD